MHDRGLTLPLLEGIAQILAITHEDEVLDAGCGDGFYLGTLSAQTARQAHGIDISIPAVEAAARRYPECEWIVANADRFIPYADQSFSVVLSVTARMNPPEFHRVLQPRGRLLVALPAPDDLVELRGASRDRVLRTLQAFSPHFSLVHQQRATTIANLSADAIHDVLQSIYRPTAAPISSGMRVTFSLDLLLFQPSPIV